MDNTLGQIISEARKKKEMSQKVLAEKIVKENGEKISPQYLNDIERNRRIPSHFILEEIAKVLGIDRDYLLLLAEKLPNDIRATILKRDQATIVNAYKAFRKKLN
jgi:transcriptional regulator with XRE-family HTH domain